MKTVYLQILFDNFLIQFQTLLIWNVNTIINTFWFAEFFFIFAFLILFLFTKQLIYNTVLTNSFVIKSQIVSSLSMLNSSTQKWSQLDTSFPFSSSINKLLSLFLRRKKKLRIAKLRRR